MQACRQEKLEQYQRNYTNQEQIKTTTSELCVINVTEEKSCTHVVVTLGGGRGADNGGDDCGGGGDVVGCKGNRGGGDEGDGGDGSNDGGYKGGGWNIPVMYGGG